MCIRDRFIISYIVTSHDMGYHNTIYRDIICDIAPDHHETTGKQARNLVRSTVYFCALSLPASLLVFLPPHLFLSSFCHSSAGRIIGLTVPPAKTSGILAPSGLGLPLELMYACVCFIWSCFSSLFLSSFFLPLLYLYKPLTYAAPRILR